MDQQNKLQKFQKAVFEEIETKIKLMREEAVVAEEAALSTNMDEQLMKAYNEIQTQVQEIRRSMKRQVAKYSLEEKRTILARRQELMQAVFDSVKARIGEYIKTEEYQTKLLQKLSAAAKGKELSNVKILVGEMDFQNAPVLKKAYGSSCEICQDKSLRLGGFILRDDANHIYFDETLETKLTEQKSYFIENSGFSL